MARIPPPKGDPDAPLRALLFDSWYDSYRGAVVMVRVMDGTLKKGDRIKFMATGRTYEVTEMGCFAPHATGASTELGPGEVGFRRRQHQDHRGHQDRRHDHHASTAPRPSPCPASAKSSRWCSPASSRPTPAEYENLRDALSKLHMNDSSFQFEPDTSDALGFGFRCGFLGLSAHGNHPGAAGARVRPGPDHDRAERRLSRLTTKTGETVRVDNPSKMPSRGDLERSKSRSSSSPCTCPPNTWARSSRCAKTAAASSSASTTPPRTTWSSPTRCRWRR